MPREERVVVRVADLVLTDGADQPMRLADLPGVQVVVIMRHRH